jgi:hypothetical protein
MNTDLTDRNYSRQSHIIVNAKYALTPSEINLILTLLTAIKKEDKILKTMNLLLLNLIKKPKKV